MQSSAEELFDKMEVLYENIFNLLSGFQKATDSSQNIIVPIKKIDGSIEQVTINSFQKLQQELLRIDANYKSLINADNLSYTLEADGTISQQTKTSFINAEYLENFTLSSDCIVDSTSYVDDLLFPNVKIPITINSTLKSDIFCKTFEILEGWSEIKENPTILDIEYLYQSGLIKYKEINRSLKLEKNHINYFGKFTIENLSSVDNVYTLSLNTIQYTGINTIGNSIDLKPNDILVSNTGASKYIINELDKFTKIIKVTRIGGSENLTVGIDKLYFNENIVDSKNIVAIPVKPVQNVIIFLSTENFANISFPSIGIKIDTTNYKVIYQNKTYTLDEFFSNYVTNFSEYLISLMNETSIPVNLGMIPEKPVLNPANFKVLQINKHLNDSKSIVEINNLNKQKQLIQNDIDFKQSNINSIQAEIDTQKYKSLDEKTAKLNKIITLRSEINTSKTNLLNITKDIDTNAIKYGLKNTIPKYKVIGFWDIQTPIYSPLTQPQNIIKYEVNYRYLSKNLDTTENTSYKMITNKGTSVSVAFSNWNDFPTKVLNKIKNIEGKLIWETQILDSVEEININQLAISINEGESIEIKIRAISEAGYPISPIKSEWSEILRVDFPTDLNLGNITATINQNNVDLNKAEFDNILQNYGLLSHVSGQIKESEKTFFHSAKDITSGQFTPEQKNIPLDIMISNLVKEINTLKNTEINNNLTVSLIDFNNESYVINNNTTLELFAGNYNEEVNILDSEKFGSIIRKKGYIKIKNSNIIPVEVKTLIPGVTFNEYTAGNYYNVPVKFENSLSQSSKQIIYFRNIDITKQNTEFFQLLKDVNTLPNTYPLTGFNIDDINSDIIFMQDGILKKAKLSSHLNIDFNAFTIEHPIYKANPNSSNINNLMLPEFDRAKLYNPVIKEKQYQIKNNSIAALVGFSDYDFFAIGKNTCGAFLYPILTNSSVIKVNGDNTTSTLIIPKESEILIPFVFEYRMTDRFGNIGFNDNTVDTSTLLYSKKIGIEMFLNNQLFNFDINVSAKYEAKIKTADSVNISSITAKFNNEQQNGLI